MSFYQIGAGRLIKAPGTPERLPEFSESDSVNIIHAANLRFNFKFVKAFFDLADPRSTWLARRITPVPPVIRPDSWFTSLACFGGWCPRFNDAKGITWWAEHVDYKSPSSVAQLLAARLWRCTKSRPVSAEHYFSDLLSLKNTVGVAQVSLSPTMLCLTLTISSFSGMTEISR